MRWSEVEGGEWLNLLLEDTRPWVQTRAVLNQFRIQVKLLTGCLLTVTVIPEGHLTLIV